MSRYIETEYIGRTINHLPTRYVQAERDETAIDIVVSKIDVVKAIDSAPSIDIEPKRGEWIDEADKYDASFGIHDYRCSNCNSYADEYIGGHEWYTVGKPNFCPYCGADMRERKESE